MVFGKPYRQLKPQPVLLLQCLTLNTVWFTTYATSMHFMLAETVRYIGGTELVETRMYGRQRLFFVRQPLAIVVWPFSNTAMATTMQCGVNTLLLSGGATMSLLILGIQYLLILLTHLMSQLTP